MRILLEVFFALALLVSAAASAHAGIKSALAAYNRQDYQAAFKEFKKLADKGNAQAQRMLAGMYEGGAGVAPSYAEAFKWYYMAAQRDDTTAQFMVGQMYYEGKGGPKDLVEAARWYGRAAEKGFAYAQNNLGVFYERGYGVSKNSAIALSYYRKAAEQGIGHAQYKLGGMYERGEGGVFRDYVSAYMWYNLAVVRDNSEEALKSLELIAEKMTPEQIERAKVGVRNWKARARK